MATQQNNPILASEIDVTPTEGSTNLITSQAVKEYVDMAISVAITQAIEGSY